MTLSAALRQVGRLWTGGAVSGFSDTQLLERFVTGGDPSEFEVLMARHGPMVLNVCRRIVNDPNDAEDAFQATFLILVKKSNSFRGQVALGPWLYQVAHRVAIRANTAAARRRAYERRAGQMAKAITTSGPAASNESLQALHEEIARLPDNLRRVIILCDLQRVPQAQAAGELHWSERTLQRRLSEGREQLKARLTRRGFAREGGMLTTLFFCEARVAIPAAWSEATLRAVVATANQAVTVGLVSASARKLTQEVLTMMLFQKLKMVSATLLAAVLLAWGASAALILPREQPSETSSVRHAPPLRPRVVAAALPAPPTANAAPATTLARGRVVGPDGTAIPSAKLYLTPAMGFLRHPYSSPQIATTGQDGRFEFTVPDATRRHPQSVITAEASNFGMGWVKVAAADSWDDLTLRLVADDVPIKGQIVDLEGKPVPGATLHLMQINAAPEEDLTRWLKALKTETSEQLSLTQKYLSRMTIAPAPKVVTDAEGRFQFHGLGRDRLITVLLDGPTIASQHLYFLTRPGSPIEAADAFDTIARYYGSSFRHVAGPTKPIIGFVRDRDTKKPLEGVTIQSYKLANYPISGFDIAETTTDAKGHYRLTGMPKGVGNAILAAPGKDHPYPGLLAKVPDTRGLDPVTVDIDLKQGVWIEGKITDKETGKPLQAFVEYFSRFNNPHLHDYPGYDGAARFFVGTPANESGSYRVVGLPGPGLITVHAVPNYLRAVEREDAEGTKERFLSTSPYHITNPENFAAIASVDVPKGADSIKRDVALESGWSFSGMVLGPDGKPLLETHSHGLTGAFPLWDSIEGKKTAKFSVRAFNPRRPRDLIFLHLEKNLAGVLLPPKQPQDSVTVHMQPGAAATGRLLDAAGKPQANVDLTVSFQSKHADSSHLNFPQQIQTDPDGRFRLEPLIPGYQYRLTSQLADFFSITIDPLASGQTKDLGDIRMPAEKP